MTYFIQIYVLDLNLKYPLLLEKVSQLLFVFFSHHYFPIISI